MFWDKKEKGLPDLPPMPVVSSAAAKSSGPGLSAVDAESAEHEEDTESSDFQKHGLPSFPDSPMQRGFSQSAIKDAIAHESTEESLVAQSPPVSTATMKTMEVEEWSSQSLPQPPTQTQISEAATRQFSSAAVTIPTQQSLPARSSRTPNSTKTDIFVKIDKFYSAKRALDNANEKLDEIDALLRKVRETKMREEQELAAWEKDLVTIKARMKEVTETIFEKGE
jgi:hypothetical protein